MRAFFRGGQVSFPGILGEEYVPQVNNRFDLLIGDPEQDPKFPASVLFAATKTTRSIFGYPSEMNDSGWVVGRAVTRGTNQSTAIVNTSGVPVSLGTGIATLGTGIASGINNAGVVVGTLDSGAFMWKAGTRSFLTYAPADTLWTVRSALKINNRGQILARADNPREILDIHWVILTPIVP